MPRSKPLPALCEYETVKDGRPSPCGLPGTLHPLPPHLKPSVGVRDVRWNCKKDFLKPLKARTGFVCLCDAHYPALLELADAFDLKAQRRSK